MKFIESCEDNPMKWRYAVHMRGVSFVESTKAQTHQDHYLGYSKAEIEEKYNAAQNDLYRILKNCHPVELACHAYSCIALGAAQSEPSAERPLDFAHAEILQAYVLKISRFRSCTAFAPRIPRQIWRSIGDIVGLYKASLLTKNDPALS